MWTIEDDNICNIDGQQIEVETDINCCWLDGGDMDMRDSATMFQIRCERKFIAFHLFSLSHSRTHSIEYFFVPKIDQIFSSLKFISEHFFRLVARNQPSCPNDS